MAERKAIDIKYSRDPSGGLVADRRLYETADGRVVGEDDPEASKLIAGAGTPIDPRTVERLGLSEQGQAEKPAGEPVPSTVTDDRPAEVVRPLIVTPEEGQEQPEAPAEQPETEEQEEEPEEGEEGEGKPRRKREK